MERLASLLSRLPSRHRRALQWFAAHAETVQSWPAPLPDGTLLASKAQGIYKPKWTKYALSVRQSLAGPYPDQEPQVRPDGTWLYLYAEEASHPKSRDSDYANRSLVACLADQIPIGVIRQISSTPNSRYRVLGLALVAGKGDGYFFLEGFSPDGQARAPSAVTQMEAMAAVQERPNAMSDTFEPGSMVDGREQIITSIVRRRGQPQFRRELLEAYGRRCAVTECDAVEALEAAHILPYRGPRTDHPSNGILLRADIHVLLDLGLVAVDAASMTVLIAPSLASTSYSELAGRKVRLPKRERDRPSKKALDQHRAWAGL